MDYLGNGLMNYLVTGAQGFLGAKVVKALRAAGCKVTPTGRHDINDVFGCDLTVASQVGKLVDKVDPHLIIHCAAHVPKKTAEYQDDLSANENLHMVKMLVASTECPLIFISSMTVYGAERDRPVVEEDAGDPTSAYGYGKWQAEQLLKAEARSSLSIRIPGLFGGSRKSGLVYNFMHGVKYAHDFSLPEFPVLWAAMHVDDAAGSIAKIASEGIQSIEAIHLAYRGSYSIESLVSNVGAIYGRQLDCPVKQPKIEFDLTRADMRRAVPSTSFFESLQKYSAEI